MHMCQIVINNSNLWLYDAIVFFMLDKLMSIIYVVDEYVIG